MPELPEVETVVRGLRPHLTGRSLARVVLLDHRSCRTPAGRFATLAGAAVAEVARRGKFIRIALAGGQTLVVHLGMTGRLMVVPAADPVAAHTHLRIELAGEPTPPSSIRNPKAAVRNRVELRFVNPRWAMGGLWMLESEEKRPVPSNVRSDAVRRSRADALTGTLRTSSLGTPPADPTAELGPDPLEIPAGEFVRLLDRRRQVKALLLDQRALAGMGNIYCDESLFAAGIDPRALAGRLSPARRRRLWSAIRRTLRAAIAAGGSSIRDYRDADGRAGWFQLKHQAYGRTGLPCRRCRRPVRHAVVAGRSTHFCPRCQKP